MVGSGKFPSGKQVAIRALLLREVVAHAFATPRDRRDKMRASASDADWKASLAQAASIQSGRLKRIQRWRKHLTRDETEFLAATLDTMTEQQHRDNQWRLEALQVLAWALGHFITIPPYDVQSDDQILKMWPPIGFERDISKTRLISSDRIIHAREIAELWHWRSRTRRLIDSGAKWPEALSRPEEGFTSYEAVARMAARAALDRGDLPRLIEDDFVAFGKPYRDLNAEQYSLVTSIARERHFALNWLCGYAPGNHWDKTPTDT